MSISFGNKNVKEMYFGNKKVAKVYFGNKLIWPKTRTPVAFDSNCTIYMDDTALANNIFKWGVRNNSTGEDLTWEIGRTNYWLYGPDGELIENKATSALSRDINNLPDGTYQISLNCENGYIANNKIPGSGTVSFNLTKVKVWKYKYYFEFIDLTDTEQVSGFCYNSGSFRIGSEYISFEQLYDVKRLSTSWQGVDVWESIPDDEREKIVTSGSGTFNIWAKGMRLYVNSDIEISNLTFESSVYSDPRNGHTIRVELYDVKTGEKVGEDEFISNGAGSSRNTIILNF